MSDLISKKELYRKLGEAYNKGYLTWGTNEIIKDIIGECDSVENKGEWIDNENGTFTCNKCGEISCCNGKFCCECGADMRGET